MKEYDWYNRNPHRGWQAAISQELARNPCFDPVSVRRRGRTTEGIKWQVSKSQYSSKLGGFQLSEQPGQITDTLPSPLSRSQPTAVERLLPPRQSNQTTATSKSNNFLVRQFFPISYWLTPSFGCFRKEMAHKFHAIAVGHPC
jgi:hypothetical protein